MSSAIWWPFCRGLKMLIYTLWHYHSKHDSWPWREPANLTSIRSTRTVVGKRSWYISLDAEAQIQSIPRHILLKVIVWANSPNTRMSLIYILIHVYVEFLFLFDRYQTCLQDVRMITQYYVILYEFAINKLQTPRIRVLIWKEGNYIRWFE